MLVAVLFEHATSSAQGRRIAQSEWRNLRQQNNESIQAFHDRFDKALLDYQRFLPTPSQGDLVLHYLDSVNAEVAKYLEREREREVHWHTQGSQGYGEGMAGSGGRLFFEAGHDAEAEGQLAWCSKKCWSSS